MDVSAATLYQFHVGFSSNQPMLQLRHYNSAWPIKPVGSANGSLQFRVVNQLVSQNPVDTLNVTVFVRFKNVQFAVPRTVFSWPGTEPDTIAVNQWEDSVSLQGAEGDGDEQDAVSLFDLVPGEGPYPVTEVVAGEDIRSLRALAQRPSRLAITGTEISVILPGGMCMYGGTTPFRLTTAGMALQCFVMAAASERVKVFPEADTWIGCASVSMANSAPEASLFMVPGHMPMTYSGPQKGAEFVIPYYYPARGRSYRCYGRMVLPSQLTSTVRAVTLYVRGVSPNFRAYYSLGDDIRVGPFLRIPWMIPTRTTNLPVEWF